MNEDRCPVCNKKLMKWYQLGGIEVLGCSDIMCNYKGKKSKEV